MESVLWERFSDQNLAKETIDDLLCERLLKLVKLNKNVSYNEVLGEEIKFFKKKIKFSCKSKTTAIGKSVKSDEKQKIFFCTPVAKFQETSTLNICDGAKQIYPKKRRKDSKKRYSSRGLM